MCTWIPTRDDKVEFLERPGKHLSLESAAPLEFTLACGQASGSGPETAAGWQKQMNCMSNRKRAKAG